MTIVNKNRPSEPAGSGNSACKPQARPADAEAFSSCFRQTLQQCAKSEQPRADSKTDARAKNNTQAGAKDHARKSAKESGPGRAGKSAKECGPGQARKNVKDKPAGSQGWGFVKDALWTETNEVLKRLDTPGNPLAEQPCAAKPSSLEEYATQFGKSFVDSVANYSTKEFYREQPAGKRRR